MANRVIIGKRGSDYGLWVSKPGYNVINTGEPNLLFSMSGGFLQVIQKGSFTIPSGNQKSINIPISGTGGSTPICFIYVYEPYENFTWYSLNNITLNIDITSSNLTIQFKYNSAYSIEGKYIILTEI